MSSLKILRFGSIRIVSKNLQFLAGRNLDVTDFHYLNNYILFIVSLLETKITTIKTPNEVS